jgi:hypothetical protein
MSAGPIFTSTVATNLLPILTDIIDDKSDGIEGGMVMKRYFEEKSMSKAYDIDLEMGGTGLASEKPEGSELAIGSIYEGKQTVYYARTFGLKFVITDEAKEDSQYPEVLKLARRGKRAMYKTVEYDAAAVLSRAWNASYVGGDGVSLVSASHTIPNGGTFSNNMATPMTPSRQAWGVARAQAQHLVGHDGLIEGYQIKKVLHPSEQYVVWQGICKSEYAPDPGIFNEINVVQRDGLEPVEVKYWTSTTTNSIFVTDCEGGLTWKWRKRPFQKTWMDNDQGVEKFGFYARWVRLWSDARCVIGNQA